MTELMPIRLSIITVVKNGMPYVAQTVESVLAQSYPHIEYIVVDGGSTDGTLDIIMRYQGRLAKWISEPDKGIADAFNKGLTLASGDYIMFLNADDALAHAQVLQDVIMAILRNGKPALIYGDYTIVLRDTGASVYTGRVEYDARKLKYGLVLPHPCLFAKRAYFEKFGVFDLNFSIAMDYEWMLRGIRQERVVHMPWVTTLIRDGGVSTRELKRAVNEIILAQKKNGYINSCFAEWMLRAYFGLRAAARRVLQLLGLHWLMRRARNWRRSL